MSWRPWFPGKHAGSNKYWEQGTFACIETQACRYRIKITADVVLAGLEQALGLVACSSCVIHTEEPLR